MGTAVEWIEPKITVGKKLAALKLEFDDTINEYECINKDTTFEGIPEELSIRRYQAMRDSNMMDQPPNIIDHYMKLI